MRALVGMVPRVSHWVAVDQTSVDGFADATGDHQWIHVGRERATRESPFGAPIAHGFLTLSLIPALLDNTFGFEQRMGVNDGLISRAIHGVCACGFAVAASFAVAGVTDVEEGGVQVVSSVALERQRRERPVRVAEFITRHYFQHRAQTPRAAIALRTCR